MAVARAEIILPSPNPLWFDLATEWIMKDLQNRPGYPLEAGVRKDQERVSAENKRLHEAARKLELTLIPLAIAALAIVGWINKDQIISALDLNRVNPAPHPTDVIGVPTSTLASFEDLKNPTPIPTDLPPTPKPTETFTPVVTPTEKPPTRPRPTSTPRPPSPTAVNVEPTKDQFAGWEPNPNGSGSLSSPISSTIDPVCLDPKYTFVGFNNFSSAPDDVVNAIDIHNPSPNFRYSCGIFGNRVAVDVMNK